MPVKDLPQWVQRAKAYPLGFAQVREDPLLDVWAIDQLNIPAANIIMIASGGCTASLLATKDNIRNITLVDPNKAQLALCQLKLKLLEEYTPNDRLALLGHMTMPLDVRRRQIEQLLTGAGYDKNQLGDLDNVSKLGPDFAGRYELLFAELQKELVDWKKEKSHHQLLENAFKNIMTIENLVALFGEGATQNPALPFWEHFYNQTRAVLAGDLATDNPFLNQLLSGKFSNTTYPWLMQPKQGLNKNFRYINSLMEDALKSNDERYDFIHLSNILDWVSTSEAENLLTIAADKLNPGGLIIIRQLNSSLDIPALGSHIEWLDHQEKELLRMDRSFFYKRIHLGRKS